MEVVAEDQGLMGLEHEVSQADDNSTYNQEDDFDFTIGGDDESDPSAENYDTNSALLADVDGNESKDETFNYEPDEQENVVDIKASEDLEQQHDASEEILGLNTEAAEATNVENEEEKREVEAISSPSGVEADVQSQIEEHTEIVEEEVDYEGADNELENLGNGPQSLPENDPVSTEHSTSVDVVSGNDGFQNTDAEAEGPEDPTSNSPNAAVEVENVETSEMLVSDDAVAFSLEAEENVGDHLREERAQYAGGDVGDIEPSYDGDEQEQLSSHENSVADLIGEAQSQENWDDEERDDEDDDARPKVTVSYQSQEYSLFAESSNQDPDYYFLADPDSIHQPLSQLLANIRDVISDEIAPSQEVFLRVNGLGFEFAESTTKDFLEETTLAHIIEVNKQLIANEGGSPSPILHCYLGLRPSCLCRLSELSKAADEGKGLSDIAMFYEDVSVDESIEDNEEHDFSQDMISDSPSLEEAGIGNEDNTEENSGSNGKEQYYNPFRATNDVGSHKASEDGFAERAELSAEALGVENTEFDDANVFENASGDFDDEFEANVAAETLDYVRDDEEGNYDVSTAENVEILDIEQHTEIQTALTEGDDGTRDGENSIFFSRPACGAVDLCLCSKCLRLRLVLDDAWPRMSLTEEHDHRAKRTKNPTRDLEANINNQEAVTNTIDDKADNDDDYLDLGNNEDGDDKNVRSVNSPIVLDGEAAASSSPLGTSPHTSNRSSATATLDGDDNGLVDTALENQESANLGNPLEEVDSHGSFGEADEIDWNHDDDGDVDDANQNPTNLSPSSPSAKRNREEDENGDGAGDENGMYCYLSHRAMPAN